MGYKANGGAEMTDKSMVRAHGDSRRLGASPALSMVGESSVTVVSGASRIPFERSSRFRRFPWCRRSSTMLRYGMAMRKREDLVFPNAAAVDVGASSHWAAVPPNSADAPVREFGAMTDDLNGLADWLISCGVDVVALESTGVYWIPVYEVLEQRGLKVWLVDARQVKYVPGRKSDVQDCQWLQRLMSYGLLRPAFRPDAQVCVMRAVARQREVLLRSQASWVQRMQKALVQMNIQLTEVISDVMGQTGQAIIRDIVAGERDAKALARHRHRRVKASEQDIVRALTGNWREEHLFEAGVGDLRRHYRSDARVRCQTWRVAGRALGRECRCGQGATRGQQGASRARRAPATGQLGWR